MEEEDKSPAAVRNFTCSLLTLLKGLQRPPPPALQLKRLFSAEKDVAAHKLRADRRLDGRSEQGGMRGRMEGGRSPWRRGRKTTEY